MNILQRIKYSSLFGICLGIYKNYLQTTRGKLGYIAPDSFFRYPILVKGPENVYMESPCSIMGNATILTTRAKFIMKGHSGAAEGLTVVTGNHQMAIGKWEVTDADKTKDADKDVVVENNVWIAANVTLLAGVTIGRGCSIGAGSVVRRSTPPYSIIAGNPAKVIGFRYTPEEIIEHEKNLYPENERLPLELLEKNYDKYFRKRTKDIINFLKQ